MLLGDEDCKRTDICRRSGKCTYARLKTVGSGYIEAGCVVGSEDDCKQSENCRKVGACIKRRDECIVPR
jgi:hypothetical protein